MKLAEDVYHRRIATLLKARKRFATATLVTVKGSAPQNPGARMIIHPDGSIESTIGGGTFEAEVIQDALASSDLKEPEIREYILTKDEIGMYCQGVVKVLLENYRPEPQLLIFGGGHVGQALSAIASACELFSVAVIDDRANFAQKRLHSPRTRVVHTDRKYEKRIPRLDEDTYAIIVTRCHETDKMLVMRLINQPLAYLGLIGSEAKIRQFRKELTKEAVSLKALDRLHAPIGLPIGGKDPAEVAISILAEVIQVKNNLRFPAHSLQINDQHP